MKAKWGLFMTEQKKNIIITSGIAVLAVILAYCFRIVGRGSFYPMLSAQLYLYRSVRCLGALRPSADRAKAGVQVYDGHRSTAHHMDGSPFGKVFYILAA